MAPHHTLKVGTLITHAGLKGRVKRLNPDRIIAQDPNDLGEWYDCEIYVHWRRYKRLWKIERRYMEVRSR